MSKTLDELRGKIEYEVDFVDVKPYSHNIISLCLQQIAREHGRNEANRAIRDFGLDDLGWHEVIEDTTTTMTCRTCKRERAKRYRRERANVLV